METFTGLRMRQFEGLLRVVRERGGNGPGGGRPWCLPLADRVLLVAVYYRTNLTMRQLAPLSQWASATLVCCPLSRIGRTRSRCRGPFSPASRAVQFTGGRRYGFQVGPRMANWAKTMVSVASGKRAVNAG